MIKQNKLIGAELDSSSQVIETSQLERLRHIYGAMDMGSLIKSGELDRNQVLGFPHFPPFLLGSLINSEKIHKVLDLNRNNILLCREAVSDLMHIKAGDVVFLKTFLADAYEQRATNNPIGFIVLHIFGWLNNELAFHCERTLAVRGGFLRGKKT